jgi:hypothetical protein
MKLAHQEVDFHLQHSEAPPKAKAGPTCTNKKDSWEKNQHLMKTPRLGPSTGRVGVCIAHAPEPDAGGSIKGQMIPAPSR